MNIAHKKYVFAAALALVFVVGIFLRTYNLEDWLFFQGDQARDAFLVSKAVENGPGYLPLLGPKAGGTFLRLGPIFYYFEYLSASIFGTSTPAVFAYPDLFFSILTLGLMYLFLKELFSKNWALALTLGYSVCYFAIQYSRFAWNPNSLPFFNLLFFYALFKFFNAEQRKWKIVWSVAIGIAYSVASQLHYVSFLIFPFIIFAVFVARRIYFKKSIRQHAGYLGIIFLIFFLFYVPVILSDVATQGNNAMNFLASIGKKSSDSGILTLLQKNYFNFSKYFLTILGGLVNLPKYVINWSGLLVVAGAFSGVVCFIREKDSQKKFLIFLVLVWFFSYFVMYTSLASQLQPRHFLVILPLPFIFLGFIALLLEKTFDFKHKIIIPIIIFALPVFANAYSVGAWFSEMGDSQQKVTKPRKSAILKSVQGESWWHLEKVARFISNDCEKETFTIIPPKEVYRSLFTYALESIGEKREDSIKWGTIDVSDKECYYFVYFTKNNYFDRYYGKHIEKINQGNFGDMTVVRFAINENELSGKKKIDNPFKKKKSAKEEKAQEERENDETDEDVAKTENSGSDSGSGFGIIQSLESIGNAGREERVFWKDLSM
ncbi:MAG: hypothetical protein US25_C0045G0006 [Candidatus Moranbacteria bacterium GW2011_GWE1_36_7]|nr:MAG: hypothetical protein UR99_C0004G0006 [Candidatus Moranbacteria bacterium GW2011_GWD2_36_12]KKQ06916.1 MAG: hypothetical protein US16_C0006G0006 [Candidatus Moranbacteria bacterium GW2011_GWE2_36_40]KKQ12756.1 MAG: hypothetical protein US25_C0045G0006 [Candidatus Moranbacteria bacterium GW2011_GWE1_36_7]